LLLTSDWFAQVGDDAVDLGQCVGSQLLLRGFGGGIGFFEVAEDEDVLVVECACRAGVVEAAGDDEALVDHHQLVVDLADAGAGLVLEQLHAGLFERLGRGPGLSALFAIQRTTQPCQRRHQMEHGVVDPR
jgi:hypothetical protein